MQQHQADDGQIARGPETGPEAGYFIDRQRHDHPFGRLHAQLSESRAQPPIAKSRPAPVPALKARCKQAGSFRKLTPQGTLCRSCPTVDALSGGRRILVYLEANVIEKGFLGKASLVMPEASCAVAHQRTKCSRSCA
jgi:hypothetical protein